MSHPPAVKLNTLLTFELTRHNRRNVVKQAWEVPSGEFKVHVGASSRDIRLSDSFTV